MRYPHRPGYKADGTSRLAADQVTSRAVTLRERVAEVLAGADMTADEAAEALRESVLAIRPRFSELRKAGKLEPTGERRKNASGHSAEVWRLVRVRHQQELFA